MNSVSHHIRLIYRAGWIALLLALVATGYSLYLLQQQDFVGMPASGKSPENVPVLDSMSGFNRLGTLQQEAELQRVNWDIIRSSADVPLRQSENTVLSRRFRLAGTFVGYDAEGDANRAILDDSENGVQHVLARGDRIGEIRIVQIEASHVVLASQGEEEIIWLNFAGRAGRGKGDDPDGSGTGADDGDMSALNRFGGRQIGQNRWEFQREALMSYYQELTDEPERLIHVFDSMRPLYNDQERIEGYQVEMVGEQDFFAAAGLLEKDIVRKVNEIDMTNRRRAEHFIRQFVNHQANAFVLEIERNGKNEKLIYQIR